MQITQIKTFRAFCWLPCNSDARPATAGG